MFELVSGSKNLSWHNNSSSVHVLPLIRDDGLDCVCCGGGVIDRCSPIVAPPHPFRASVWMPVTGATLFFGVCFGFAGRSDFTGLTLSTFDAATLNATFSRGSVFFAFELLQPIFLAKTQNDFWFYLLICQRFVQKCRIAKILLLFLWSCLFFTFTLTRRRHRISWCSTLSSWPLVYIWHAKFR